MIRLAQRLFEQLADWLTGGNLLGAGVKMQDQALDALQKCIMQIASDAFPFDLSLFKKGLRLLHEETNSHEVGGGE